MHLYSASLSQYFGKPPCPAVTAAAHVGHVPPSFNVHRVKSLPHYSLPNIQVFCRLFNGCPVLSSIDLSIISGFLKKSIPQQDTPTVMFYCRDGVFKLMWHRLPHVYLVP
ncbi:hypothetical protein XENOCAPTIV_004758 [Xenoophorus captivus]|uniref:Uncharacterized protein n=1 Tax=Xenoophorus captivus TaxID=1517983 RepID=A0ABV0R8Q8_9TELE